MKNSGFVNDINLPDNEVSSIIVNGCWKKK